MKWLLSLILMPLLAFAQVNALTPQDAAAGWILLFDGETLFGWTGTGGANWRVSGGAIVADAGESGWLRTNASFHDFVLRCQFRTAADGNSGVFLRSAREGEPHVTGYEVQIWDQHPKFPTGSLVNHAAARKTRILPNEWNLLEMEVRGDRFIVRVNGSQVLDARQAKSAVGHIGLQYNAGKPIEFRDIRLRPTGLAPIFNGKDLSGWRKVESPRAKEPPVWSVANGELHVEKGPGQLETEDTYADFVFQLDIRANSGDPKRHPNSGVFLRGDPDGYWTGYESQIRNEYKDGDRTQAVDFGTGGIYRNQAARKVVSDDNRFFTKTIVAYGRHMAVWVDGYQVSDWEDPNPEGQSVRKKEAVLKAGTISLQAHDPTTNLDFRNMRLARLPAR